MVQSYFVYWARIESPVVHDGSRSPQSGANTTVVDGEALTAPPGMKPESDEKDSRYKLLKIVYFKNV